MWRASAGISRARMRGEAVALALARTIGPQWRGGRSEGRPRMRADQADGASSRDC